MSYYTIIRGSLGIGKSTIAKSLAKNIKSEYIAYDRILDKHNLTKDKEEGYISEKSFLRANELITPKAKKFLDKGVPVIFDGNFYWKSQIEDLINRLDYPHHVFTLKAPLKVCIERDSKRKKTYGKDATEAVYRKSTEFSYGIVIDTNNKTTEQVVKEIRKRLR